MYNIFKEQKTIINIIIKQKKQHYNLLTYNWFIYIYIYIYISHNSNNIQEIHMCVLLPHYLSKVHLDKIIFKLHVAENKRSRTIMVDNVTIHNNKRTLCRTSKFQTQR
jgi:hypothetical protein